MKEQGAGIVITKKITTPTKTTAKISSSGGGGASAFYLPTKIPTKTAALITARTTAKVMAATLGGLVTAGALWLTGKNSPLSNTSKYINPKGGSWH